MALPRLVVENVTGGRGERPLFRELTLTLDAGEAVRVLGDNGSGKTTLLRTIGGLHAPFDGRVEWHANGGDGDEPRTLLDDLCFVGHDNALSGALTPVENLDVLMRLSARRCDQPRIRRVLADLGLKRAAHRPCERLSAGQRRRVSLARLWLTDARLWLLDEPASALDRDSRAALCTRIAAHVNSGGMVLFTTHEKLLLPDVSVRGIELAAC